MTLLQGEKNRSVLPRYLRLGGPPGLKTKDLTQQKLMVTSRTWYFKDITQ